LLEAHLDRVGGVEHARRPLAAPHFLAAVDRGRRRGVVKVNDAGAASRAPSTAVAPADT